MLSDHGGSCKELNQDIRNTLRIPIRALFNEKNRKNCDDLDSFRKCDCSYKFSLFVFKKFQKVHTGAKNVKFCNDRDELHMKLCLTYHTNDVLEDSFNREVLEKCSLLFSIHEMPFTYHIYA